MSVVERLVDYLKSCFPGYDTETNPFDEPEGDE